VHGLREGFGVRVSGARSEVQCLRDRLGLGSGSDDGVGEGGGGEEESDEGEGVGEVYDRWDGELVVDWY
jgi:hypothetical protein